MKLDTLRFQALPIFEQLAIEEALLRADERDILLVNVGSPPSVVMGISGKAHELVDEEYLQREQIPLIRRFSGGGTVYVDKGTLFVTLICNEKSSGVPAQPLPILEWGAKFYQRFIPSLKLQENDFVIGDKKIGGNAQYIRKGRWLLHTSFLFNYSIEKMNCLKLPPKRPQYRLDRSHADFLMPLKGVIEIEGFVSSLLGEGKPLVDLEGALKRPHRKSTVLVNL